MNSVHTQILEKLISDLRDPNADWVLRGGAHWHCLDLEESGQTTRVESGSLWPGGWLMTMPHGLRFGMLGGFMLGRVARWRRNQILEGSLLWDKSE